MMSDEAQSLRFGADHISALFSEDPVRYSASSEFLDEIRKRASPFYKNATHLTPKLIIVSADVPNGLNGHLVRFRGLIQNFHASELFAPSYTVEMEGGQRALMAEAFNDVVGSKNSKIIRVVEHDTSKFRDRTLYMVSTLPGEMEWTRISKDEQQLGDGIRQLSINGEDSRSPEEPIQVVIRIYDELSKEFLISDIIDFYGIFYEGLKAEQHDSAQPMADSPDAIAMLYRFPNVHVIEHRILGRADLVNGGRPSLASPAAVVFEHLQQFANSLTGCDTAALYYLSAMVAKTYSWREEVPIPLCSMPFAFLNVKDSRSLIECAKLLVPLVCVLPITASTLENERLFSRMDHQDGILRCGKLQLCRGTLLILDFTKYTTAAIARENNFVRDNVSALQRLIVEQKLTIDYGVYKHGLETDVPIMALCPGVNTYFLKFSALVPIPNPFTDGLDPVAELRSLNVAGFRWHLSNSRERLSSIEMGREEQKKIVESFTEIRQQLNSAAPDHFRHLLTLSRILTALRGDSEIRNSTFQELMRSEYKRLDFLKLRNLI